MKFGSCLIVGAGGIGTHLAEPLVRLLAYHENGCSRVTIVDGDVYEEKNRERQLFDAGKVGMNKAAALQDSLLSRLGDHDREIRAVEGYVAGPDDAAGLMVKVKKKGEPLLVVLCVDNDATRRAFYDGLEVMPLDHPDVVIVDCSNDLETSTVVASFWKKRKSMLVNPVEMYENLRKPKDAIPGGGCLVAAPSTPQLMVANMSAALGAIMIIQALLDGKRFTDVIQGNIRDFDIGQAGGSYGG